MAGDGAGADARSTPLESDSHIRGVSIRCTTEAADDSRRCATNRSGPLEMTVWATGLASPLTWPLGPSGSTTWPSGARKLGLCDVASDAVNESRGATGGVLVRVGRSGGRSRHAARCTGGGAAGRVVPVADCACGRAGSASARLHQRATGSPPSFNAHVDLSDFTGKALAFPMLEVEQIVERPVEMKRDVRDLFVDPVGRVRHDSPRRPPATSTANWCSQLGQVTAALVWPS